MALVIPYTAQTWTDGVSAASAARLTVIEAGVHEAHFQPSVRAWHNADQAIVNATWSGLNLNSEDWDSAGNVADTMHDLVTNNHRLTCRYAGKYLAIGRAVFAGNATGDRFIAIVKNGGAPPTPGQGDWKAHWTADATTNQLAVSGLYDLAVNDWLVLAVYQDSGGNLNVAGTTAVDRPLFSMVRVG